MTRTYIFNPEHDLAMAYGTEGYTAPPRAQLLRRNLQMLPAWYCTTDGVTNILSQNVADDTLWLQQMSTSIGLQASPIAINRLQCRHSSYHPWGWDFDLRGRLLNACVAHDDLPQRQQIATLHKLAHRRMSITLLDRLGEVIDMEFPPRSIEASSVEEIRHFNSLYPTCYIKAPWSGSGKGIYRVLDDNSRNFATWAQGIINRQGSIMCEAPLDKIMDFAMEFTCSGGIASFLGYSIFTNDSHCSYDCGIVAPQCTLMQAIDTRLRQPGLLAALQKNLCTIITELIAPHYNGYLGIDMMLYNGHDGSVRLNPCVELNLRMTMGAVAVIIADRHLAKGSTATIGVSYYKSPQQLKAAIASASASNPLRTANGKIASGFLPLVPTYPDSRFLAHLTATIE